MISFNGQNILKDRIILEKKEAKINGSNILSYNTYNKNLNELEKCTRRIVINNKIYGTGFLMELQKEKNPFYCLITNEHVIPEDLIENNTEIEILYAKDTQEEIFKIKLNKKERFIRNYGYLGVDATVIEIFPEKNEINKEFFFKNDDIEILAKSNYEMLKNNNIHILQYPGSGNTLSISQGEYLGIYNLNEFYHSASTESGSSGSPIFIFYDSRIVIFGIHRAGKQNKNLGEFIYPIIHSLKINAIFDKSSAFKGEIIEKKDYCIQKGELKIEEGKIYIGELLRYKPNGKGTLYECIECKEKNKKKYKVKYCGDFVNGKFEGHGKYFYNYKENKYYEGEFKNNKRHGYGKYYIKNKLKYEGEFKDDEYDGIGTMYYKDGSYYKGGFAAGKKNGEGAIYNRNNTILEEGEFEDNITPINGIIRRISQTQNLNDLNNTLNQVFSCGRTLLNIFGIETNFICDNCGCSTDEHHLLEGSVWECHRCNKRCKNNCLLNLFNN